MPRLFMRRFKATACMILSGAALLSIGDSAPRLWLYDEGRQLVMSARTDSFSVRFIHSINLSPVDEDFSLSSDGALVLVRERFDQFGTGMPTGEDDGVGMEDGRYVTRPLRRFPEIALRVLPVPGHILSIRERTTAFTRWAPAGGLLILRAKPFIGTNDM